MVSQLRRYFCLWLRWHARLAEYLALQRHPAWWC